MGILEAPFKPSSRGADIAETTISTSSEKGSLIGEIEDFIRTLVVDMSPSPPAAVGPGRPTILPALALWSGLLVCVLRGFNAQLDLWRLLRDHRGTFPASLFRTRPSINGLPRRAPLSWRTF